MAMVAMYKSQFDVLLLLKLNSLNEGGNRQANITLFLFMSYNLFDKKKQNNCPNTQINHLITQISLSKIDKKWE